MGILAAAAFAVQSTYHMTKGKIPGQLIFGQGMIIPINHVADWGYICQRKQTQLNKDVICENTTRFDHDYRVGDKFLTKNNSAYKYKNRFKNQYEILQMWKNGTVTLLTGFVITRNNIRNIEPYNNTDV